MCRSKAVVIGVLVAMCQVAAARDGVPSLGDLDRAQGEAVYYKAEAAAAEARAQAESRRGGLGGIPSLHQVVAAETPRGTASYVVFVYPGGGRIEAAEGDELPGGYVVKRIQEAQNQVLLQRGKEVVRVGFAGRAGSAAR